MEPGTELIPLTGNHPAIAQAHAVVIASPSDAELAVECVRTLKMILLTVAERERADKKQYDALHKDACRREAEAEAPVKAAIAALNAKITAWNRNVAAQAEALEIHLAAQNKEAAEDARIAELAEAEADGDEAAFAVLSAAPVAYVVPKVELPKIPGTQTHTDWYFEIEDANALSREWLTPDLKAIGAYVRAKKSDAQIPGIRVYSETKSSVRG